MELLYRYLYIFIYIESVCVCVCSTAFPCNPDVQQLPWRRAGGSALGGHGFLQQLDDPVSLCSVKCVQVHLSCLYCECVCVCALQSSVLEVGVC